MTDFLSELKEFMISEEIDDACGYYETILQSKELLKEIINEGNTYHTEIQYEEDDSGGYTNGLIRVYLYKETEEDEICGIGYVMDSMLDHHYTIQLVYDERYWGYCNCKPEDEGYDPVHNCCGNGCDWSAPRINVERIHNVAYESFNGSERDMWALKDKWNKSDDELKEKLVLQQVKSLEEQIFELEKRKDLLMKNK